MAKSTKKTVKSNARKTTAKPKKAARKAASPPAQRTLHTITPYLSIKNAAAAIEWYKKAFNAKETSRQMVPGDMVMHAALRIGDSEVYLSDIFPGTDMQDPSRAGASVTIQVHSKNNDKLWQQAVANGAKVTMPLDNMFWGDRYGRLVDPFGHAWAFNYPAKMTAAEKEAKRVEAMKQMGG